MKKFLVLIPFLVFPLSAYSSPMQADEEAFISCHEVGENEYGYTDDNGNIVRGPEDERPEFVFQRFLEAIWQDRYATYLDCHKYFIDAKSGTPEGFGFFVSIFSEVRNHWDGQFNIQIIETPIGKFAKVYPVLNGASIETGLYFTMRQIGHRWYMENIIPGVHNPETLPPAEREPETKK